MDSLITFIEIVFINILLSGDNAVVIALAAQQLPKEQRKKAVWWGAGAAVGLRCLLTFIAITLLELPFIQIAGALMLFIIAVKLVTDAAGGDALDDSKHVRKAGSLGQAVRTIIAADFIMSLDNVLAIAAIAEGEPILIFLGIAISIPMIIWGSQLLSKLLLKYPVLVYLGGGLLGFAAGEMFVHDPVLSRVTFSGMNTLTEALPVLCVPLVIVVALLRLRR
ncbi:YjbE family integral membrane protein [Paenibacillus phyllosphaerae]|uniref:YjbE family integral membrane protein n=1 Tax=Paenibacillus phyllosphaerae TaxID=274593 RepID=A0A7W5AUP4_9BACL|nr:YjbE family putative metal transport protein [Paenibacillus phyllosphaerae]MBB3109028.1 YjbE family integral membrane protein [Paenibacillus phyllosphaerae]